MCTRVKLISIINIDENPYSVKHELPYIKGEKYVISDVVWEHEIFQGTTG